MYNEIAFFKAENEERYKAYAAQNPECMQMRLCGA